jgi:hypothetical protein
MERAQLLKDRREIPINVSDDGSMILSALSSLFVPQKMGKAINRGSSLPSEKNLK